MDNIKKIKLVSLVLILILWTIGSVLTDSYIAQEYAKYMSDVNNDNTYLVKNVYNYFYVSILLSIIVYGIITYNIFKLFKK